MAAVSVDDDPVVTVVAGDGTRRQVAVANDGANPVYLGVSSAVTSDDGYPLAAGEHFACDLGESQTLYGVCASGQSTTLRTIVV